jgi:hypothetical protein
MSENYLKVLIESQNKKLRLLEEAEQLDKEILLLIREEQADMDAIDANMTAKGDLIEKLDELDDGFESIYEKIRTDLQEHKELYKNEIRILQNQISQITEKTVKIRALEERSRREIEAFFENRKKKIRAEKSSVKIANAYAVNMRRINKVDSFFVDKKK